MIKKPLSVAVTAFLVLSAAPTHAQTSSNTSQEEVLRLIQEDRTKHIMSLYEKAKAGNADAQYDLGFLYELGGNGVDQNLTTAFQWYNLAAAQGHENATSHLISMYEIGQGTAQNSALAKKLKHQLLLKTNPGYAQTYSEISKHPCYLDGQKSSMLLRYAKDLTAHYKTEAFLAYHKNAAKQPALAMFELGQALYEGKGIEENQLLAQDCWQKAAEKDNAKAMYNLGYYAFHDKFLAEQLLPNMPLFWLEKAARAGDPRAQFFMGSIAAEKQPSGYSLTDAYTWLLLSAADDVKTDPSVLPFLENANPAYVTMALASMHRITPQKSGPYRSEEETSPDQKKQKLGANVVNTRFYMDLLARKLTSSQTEEARNKAKALFPDLAGYIPKPYTPNEQTEPPNPRLSSLLEKAEAGDVQAQLKLTQTYVELFGNFEKAYFWTAVAAARGNEEAQTALKKLEEIISKETAAKQKSLAAAWKPKETKP